MAPAMVVAAAAVAACWVVAGVSEALLMGRVAESSEVEEEERETVAVGMEEASAAVATALEDQEPVAVAKAAPVTSVAVATGRAALARAAQAAEEMAVAGTEDRRLAPGAAPRETEVIPELEAEGMAEGMAVMSHRRHLHHLHRHYRSHRLRHRRHSRRPRRIHMRHHRRHSRLHHLHSRLLRRRQHRRRDRTDQWSPRTGTQPGLRTDWSTCCYRRRTRASSLPGTLLNGRARSPPSAQELSGSHRHRLPHHRRPHQRRSGSHRHRRRPSLRRLLHQAAWKSSHRRPNLLHLRRRDRTGQWSPQTGTPPGLRTDWSTCCCRGRTRASSFSGRMRTGRARSPASAQGLPMAAPTAEPRRAAKVAVTRAETREAEAEAAAVMEKGS